MSDGRAILAAKQAELMRALWAKGPVPTGFDSKGVLLEGETLLSKRRRFVMKMRPALARALGRRFSDHFAAFAAANPLPAHACADASRFASWFEDRLGEEDVLERINWQVGLKALLASSRREALSADMKADLDQFGALIQQAVKRRGPLALEEPRLKVALIIGSVAALGVELERGQIEPLRAALHEELAPTFEEDSPSSLLEAGLASLRVSVAVERVLERVLRPEQQERYLAEAGEDPFLGQNLPLLSIPAPTVELFAEAVAHVWTKAFVLGEGTLPAARKIAADYAREVFAPQPASGRGAMLARTAHALELQNEAETRLVEATAGEERDRIAKTRGSIIILRSAAATR
ncbi:MAG TPA: hypothetical protein VFF73_41405 [Planctomycetota bacterium]|nr:hypothetical protein [Planctomycetota bacterium]